MLSFHKWSATETLGNAGLLTERDWNEAFLGHCELLPNLLAWLKKHFLPHPSLFPCTSYF